MKRLLLVLLLVGCKRPDPGVERLVMVPCPEPPVLLWPDLPTDHITATSSREEVALAYVQTKAILKGRLAEAYTLLNGYRAKTKKTEIP